MPDFSGMATVYNVPCNDGRTIKPGAFDHQDGEVVPIVWRHTHGKITNFIGHGTLRKSASPPGMRISGDFNSTTEGRQAKQLVDSKDITNLSIWANEVLEHAMLNDETRRQVERGTIREVSLVIAGANPGAKIDDNIIHNTDPFALSEFEMDGIIIHTDVAIELPEEEAEEEAEEETTLEHEGPTLGDIIQELNPEQESLFNYVLHSVATGEDPEPNLAEAGEGRTMQEVFNTLSHEQRTSLEYFAGVLKEGEGEEEIQHTDEDTTVVDFLATLDEDQQAAVDDALEEMLAGETTPDDTPEVDEEPIDEVFNTLSQEQQTSLMSLVGEINEDDE